jgi:putative transposase
MKAFCLALGVARSHVHELAHRPEDWINGRTAGCIDPVSDAMLVEAVRAEITALPTYGYRRAGAPANRIRSLIVLRPVNHQRFYRVMKQHCLLLPKAPKRRASSRPHEGMVAVPEPDRRWCSDGFEIACDNGQVVTRTFAKDRCDREIIAWRAWSGRGLLGELEPVREMLTEAVEKRFGKVDAGPAILELEFLNDGGGACRAHETHAIAMQLGLTPIHTPICRPQSNGIAENFVNTLKRDDVSQMDRSTAAAVFVQLADAFERFNEVHPHSALRRKSPRTFRRELAR